MTDLEAIKAAEDLDGFCEEHKGCEGCIFDLEDGCALDGDVWDFKNRMDEVRKENMKE